MTTDADKEGRVIPFRDPHKAIDPPPPETSPVPAEPVIEAEFIDDEPKTALAVDQPHDVIDLLPWQQEDERRPIIHAALTKEHRAAAFRWYAGKYTHHARFHFVRIPWYAAKILVYNPRGAVRVVRDVSAWVGHAETKAIKTLAVRHAQTSLTHLEDGHKIYHAAERVAAPKVRARRIVLTAALLLILIGFPVLWFIAPRWAFPLAAATGVTALGYAGKPLDQPLIGHAVVSSEYTKLTSDMVDRALRSMGIAALSAKDARIGFPAPIQRDGDGWRADVDLPHGVIASDIIKQRHRLAGNLRCPVGCVWPEVASEIGEHRLVLWRGDKDLAKKGNVHWPLANKGTHDFFDRAPVGVDPRGRPITVPLFQHNILIGSVPGNGKTNATICFICGAALDPTVELWIHDLGKGDLDPFEEISKRYTSGAGNSSIEYTAKSLHMLKKEVMRRAEAIKTIPKDMRPDGNKISREIADKRVLRMWPIVCVIDECHFVFEHPDYGPQARSDTKDIIRIGRAMGITLILSTQRPDKDALPTGVTGNISIRLCFYVAGQIENDMILGTSAYQNGVRATKPNLRPEIDAGIGVLTGPWPTELTVKVAYFSARTIARVVARAKALREAAGTLDGPAIGDTTNGGGSEITSLLDDLNVVYRQLERSDHAGVWSQDLCAGLTELRPDVYSGWDQDTLAGALRPYAVRTVQLNMLGDDGVRRNRFGLRRELLEQAMTVRAERRKEKSL